MYAEENHGVKEIIEKHFIKGVIFNCVCSMRHLLISYDVKDQACPLI